MVEVSKGDHVLCDRLGKEEFEVVVVRDREYDLKSTVTGKTQPIFKAHCFVPPAMRMRNMRERQEARATVVSKILNPQPKPGKKR